MSANERVRLLLVLNASTAVLVPLIALGNGHGPQGLLGAGRTRSSIRT
jgi:hypothetical protein